MTWSWTAAGTGISAFPKSPDCIKEGTRTKKDSDDQ